MANKEERQILEGHSPARTNRMEMEMEMEVEPLPRQSSDLCGNLVHWTNINKLLAYGCAHRRIMYSVRVKMS